MITDRMTYVLAALSVVFVMMTGAVAAKKVSSSPAEPKRVVEQVVQCQADADLDYRMYGAEVRATVLEHNQVLLLQLLDAVVTTKQWGTRARLPTGISAWHQYIDGVVHSYDVNAFARSQRE